MDLLYSRYASPNEFMNLYIEQGRFGEFVWNIVNLENTRRKEQAEANIQHSGDENLTEEQIQGIIERAFSFGAEGD